MPLVSARGRGREGKTRGRVEGRRKGEVTPVDQTNVEGETPTDQVGVKEEDMVSRGAPKETS